MKLYDPANDTLVYLSQRNRNLLFTQKQVNGKKKEKPIQGMLITALSVMAPKLK